jgi:proteasome lid subunit RPN8/RPN11
MNNLNETKEFVKMEALKDPSRECCGLILEKESGTVAIPCENVSPNPEAHFIISPLDVMELSKSGKLIGFYHSHVMDEEFKLSKYDRLVSQRLMLDSVIYSVTNDRFIHHKPNKHKPDYINRPFIIGLYDCFTLTQDYYKYELNIHIPDPIESVQKIYRTKEKGEACPTLLKPYYDKWDFSDSEEFDNIVKLRYDPLSFHKITRKIKNKFWIKEHFLANRFKEVNDTKAGDILLINISVYGKEATFPSHCAIFAQNNEIMHHPLNAMSRRAVYGKIYKDLTACILRHKDMI